MVLLNVNFFLGETELGEDYDSHKNTLWLDMSWFARILHVFKQVGERSLRSKRSLMSKRSLRPKRS
jgi:hypothetical protein